MMCRCLGDVVGCLAVPSMAIQWCQVALLMSRRVLRWCFGCFGGVTVMSRSCVSAALLMYPWCFNDFSVVSHWCQRCFGDVSVLFWCFAMSRVCGWLDVSVVMSRCCFEGVGKKPFVDSEFKFVYSVWPSEVGCIVERFAVTWRVGSFDCSSWCTQTDVNSKCDKGVYYIPSFIYFGVDLADERRRLLDLRFANDILLFVGPAEQLPYLLDKLVTSLGKALGKAAAGINFAPGVSAMFPWGLGCVGWCVIGVPVLSRGWFGDMPVLSLDTPWCLNGVSVFCYVVDRAVGWVFPAAFCPRWLLTGEVLRPPACRL